MSREKTTVERGKYKGYIHKALLANSDLKELLIGSTSGITQTEVLKKFKEHVKSHLFIEDTLIDTGSYIFYDVYMPVLRNQLKECKIVIYAISHRDTLENYSKNGYYGDKSDIMTQMIEDSLICDKDVSNKFGIGEITLDSIDIYNAARFYGSILTFTVNTFR